MRCLLLERPDRGDLDGMQRPTIDLGAAAKAATD
jgi:hypothetical protein